jgi:hypothetical protein
VRQRLLLYGALAVVAGLIAAIWDNFAGGHLTWLGLVFGVYGLLVLATAPASAK